MNNASQTAATAQSPLSRCPKKNPRAARVFLLKQLEEYYGGGPPADAVEAICTLGMCRKQDAVRWPPIQAAYVFTNGSWLLLLPWHPVDTAKWSRQIKAENSVAGKGSRCLDVGCGKGDFLKGLDFIPTKKSSPWISTSRRSLNSQQDFMVIAARWMRRWQPDLSSTGNFPSSLRFIVWACGSAGGFVRRCCRPLPRRTFVHTATNIADVFEADWFDISTILRTT